MRQRAASERQRGSRRGQEGCPAPPYRASWSTGQIVSYFSMKMSVMLLIKSASLRHF